VGGHGNTQKEVVNYDGRASIWHEQRTTRLPSSPTKNTWMMASLGIQKEQPEIEFEGGKVTLEKQMIDLGVE
jgi:hypothetical protein